ncbi:hypothetical protein B0H13DRAFT_2335460 [Mycena leptocephala]|nr:hypothetical protein B0H13DRAFT_2335460 [Mycena leptocephala]
MPLPEFPSNPLLFAPLTTSYVSVAFLTLLSYDVLLNVSEEYHHIWKSKWSLIKCLYLWSRYGPFIDTIFTVLKGGGLITDLLFGVSPTSCNTLTKFNTVFSIFGIGVTENHPFKSEIAVIVLLTLWKFVHYKASGVAGTFRSSRLMISFYRDGIMFYVAILAFFIGIVILQSGSPTEFKLIGLT